MRELTFFLREIDGCTSYSENHWSTRIAGISAITEAVGIIALEFNHRTIRASFHEGYYHWTGENNILVIIEEWVKPEEIRLTFSKEGWLVHQKDKGVE